MCEPVSMTMAALAVAQQGAQLYGQNKQAAAGMEAVADKYAMQRTSSAVASREAAEVAASEKMTRERQAAREASRLRVAIGGAGIEGNSPLRQIADVYQQADLDLTTMSDNAQSKQNQLQRKMFAAKTSAEGEIDSIHSKTASPFMAGLQIASAGAGGYLQGATLASGARAAGSKSWWVKPITK